MHTLDSGGILNQSSNSFTSRRVKHQINQVRNQISYPCTNYDFTT